MASSGSIDIRGVGQFPKWLIDLAIFVSNCVYTFFIPSLLRVYYECLTVSARRLPLLYHTGAHIDAFWICFVVSCSQYQSFVLVLLNYYYIFAVRF